MSTKTEQYVINNYPLAKKAGEKYGMDPIVILAQGAYESAWGTSTLSNKYRNFFGITASGKTNEYWKGTLVQTETQYKLKFRTYATAQDSFYDFARLISSNYKAAFAAGKDYKLYAKQIANSAYISETNGDNRTAYMNGIISIYETILDIAKKKVFSPNPPLA
jgi:peptidoglycan hydrolase FlgJ